MFFCVAVVQMISVDKMADDGCPHSLCHSCIELLIAECTHMKFYSPDSPDIPALVHAGS